MAQSNTTNWRLDRRVNLSVLLQLMVLASLIVGSWLNLQRQLDLLQRDVTMLLQARDRYTEKLDALAARNTSHEYRLQVLERQMGERP